MSPAARDRQLRESRVESGETRRAVDAAVAELQSLRPGSLDEPGFRQALDKFSRARYVNGVLRIRLDGHIAFSTVRFRNNSGSVQDLALDETRRVLSEMPEGFLSTQQRIALPGNLVALFAYLLARRPLSAPSGRDSILH